MTNVFYQNQTLVAKSTLSKEQTLDRMNEKVKLTPSQRAKLTFVPSKTPEQCRSECTDSDGGVYGVRYFDFCRGARRSYLVSPTSRFVWDDVKAVAVDFKNSSAVRGHNGFHAAWVEELQRWQKSTIDHVRCEVMALVKGSGDLIIGKKGWRSEKLKIVACASSDKIVKQLQPLYPIQFVALDTSEIVEFEWVVDPARVFTRRMDMSAYDNL